MSDDVAPVSTTPPVLKVQPKRPVTAAVVGHATNLNSSINAINRISKALTPDVTKPAWTETHRTVVQVRIENPDDKEQWVEVERITELTFTNSATNEQLVWLYKKAGSN